MKLSEIKDIGAAQKMALEQQEQGLKRLVLPELPDIQSHALVGAETDKIINAIRKLNVPNEYPDLYGDGNCASNICDILRQ